MILARIASLLWLLAGCSSFTGVNADSGAPDAADVMDAALSPDSAVLDGGIDAASADAGAVVPGHVSIADCLWCAADGKTCIVYADRESECIAPGALSTRPGTPACRVIAGTERFRSGFTRAAGDLNEPGTGNCGLWMDCVFSEAGTSSCAAPPAMPSGLGPSPWASGENGLCDGCSGSLCNVYADGAYECNSFPSRSYAATGGATVDFCSFDPASGALTVGTCTERRCSVRETCTAGDECDFDGGVAGCVGIGG